MAEVEEVRHFVGDDHGGAGLGDPRHLAQRRLGVVEMVEPAVAQHGVERPVAKGHVLGLAENELEVAAGVLALAGGELGRGHVDADDRPVLGKPARVDAVAYGDVEQANAGRLRQMSQNHVARPPLAAVDGPEDTLPEPDFRPELAVVKIGCGLVVVGRGVANDEHAVANREARAAPLGGAVEAGVGLVKGAVTAGAAKRPGAPVPAPKGDRVVVAVASVSTSIGLNCMAFAPRSHAQIVCSSFVRVYKMHPGNCASGLNLDCLAYFASGAEALRTPKFRAGRPPAFAKALGPRLITTAARSIMARPERAAERGHPCTSTCPKAPG